MNAKQRRTDKRKFLKEFNKAVASGLVAVTESNLSKEDKKVMVEKLKAVK